MVTAENLGHIPPFQIGDKFVTNFTEKAKAFNIDFPKQWRVVDSLDRANFGTNERSNNIKSAKNGILKTIKNLEITKVHGHDNVSIRMIKLCED